MIIEMSPNESTHIFISLNISYGIRVYDSAFIIGSNKSSDIYYPNNVTSSI